MSDFNCKEVVEVLRVIMFVICVCSVDWAEADKPGWNKEKVFKAMEFIIEAIIFILGLWAKTVT